MVINVKKSDIYIPEWNDNRDLPEAEQIKFHHRFLTTAEREQFVYWKNYTEGEMSKLATMVGDNFDFDDYVENNKREWVQDKEGIARKIITKIENLVIKDESGKEETLDTIEKFYSAPDAFASLRAEIEGYVLTLSAKAESKN